MLWSVFFQYFALFWVKNANCFANFFCENILKIITSVPGVGRQLDMDMEMAAQHTLSHMYAHAYVCTCICMHMHMYAHAYVCTCICMHMHMYAHAYVCLSLPGTNPTIVTYNASTVEIYNATSSLVYFENKNNFFCFEKRSYRFYSTLALYLFYSEVVGSGPESGYALYCYCKKHWLKIQ
jgi:hypothetical protein